jgi:hypothetical protein
MRKTFFLLKSKQHPSALGSMRGVAFKTIRSILNYCKLCKKNLHGLQLIFEGLFTIVAINVKYDSL